MSLTQALATAVSGLRANQAGLAIVAGNVANAETPGYTRKTPVQITTAQRPPDRRVDIFNADGTVDATIATKDGTYQCSQANSQWQCGQLGQATGSDNGVLSADTVKQAADGFRQRAADFDFRIEPRSIANVSVSVSRRAVCSYTANSSRSRIGNVRPSSRM